MQWESFDWLLEAALAEDGVSGDVTTLSLVPADAEARGRVVVRDDGIICGLPLVERLLAKWDEGLEFAPQIEEGSWADAPSVAASLAGFARGILGVERVLLNFLQRLSGVATTSRRCAEKVAGTGARVFDTRKTLPGWRALEKYAVRCGGASNHRFNLTDQVLIKDNHLKLLCAIKDYTEEEAVEVALEKARAHSGGQMLVEIEVQTLEQLRRAVEAGADIVMLDNMAPAQLSEAVAAVRDMTGPPKRPRLEASGGVTLQNLRDFAETGVDRISVGALTHSAPALDLSMDVELL